MKRRNYAIAFFALCIPLFLNGYSFAFDNDKTHPKITEKATEYSGVDQYLRDHLEFSVDTENFGAWESKRSPREWLDLGSTKEDEPMCRASNHFHNPLKNWAESGLTDTRWDVNLGCNFLGEYPSSAIKSAIDWATGYTSPSPDGNHTEAVNNDFDWDSARRYYEAFLTGQISGSLPLTESQRNYYIAKCFRTIGNVMHLLQDMAVPAHVRNDFNWGHTSLTSGKLGNRFEIFIAKNQQYHPEWFAIPQNWFTTWYNSNGVGMNLERAPLTKFWDSGFYRGLNAYTPQNDLGLAEYTNMNYASDMTIFAETKPLNDKHFQRYPQAINTNLAEIDFTSPEFNGRNRLYVKKYGKEYYGQYGESIDHFATPTFFNESLKMTSNRYYNERAFVIDDRCHEDYAKKILPVAVGYSASLLKYFFRGEIDLVSDEQTGSGYIIRNDSDEDMNGTFKLYYDNTNGERVELISGGFPLTTSIPPNSESGNINFDSPSDINIAGKYILVFKGTLGNEHNAVVGRVTSASEVFVIAMGAETDIQNIGPYPYLERRNFGNTLTVFAWDAQANDYHKIPRSAGGFIEFPCPYNDPDFTAWRNSSYRAMSQEREIYQEIPISSVELNKRQDVKKDIQTPLEISITHGPGPSYYVGFYFVNSYGYTSLNGSAITLGCASPVVDSGYLPSLLQAQGFYGYGNVAWNYTFTETFVGTSIGEFLPCSGINGAEFLCSGTFSSEDCPVQNGWPIGLKSITNYQYSSESNKFGKMNKKVLRTFDSYNKRNGLFAAQPANTNTPLVGTGSVKIDDHMAAVITCPLGEMATLTYSDNLISEGTNPQISFCYEIGFCNHRFTWSGDSRIRTGDYFDDPTGEYVNCGGFTGVHNVFSYQARCGDKSMFQFYIIEYTNYHTEQQPFNGSFSESTITRSWNNRNRIVFAACDYYNDNAYLHDPLQQTRNDEFETAINDLIDEYYRKITLPDGETYRNTIRARVIGFYKK